MQKAGLKVSLAHYKLSQFTQTYRQCKRNATERFVPTPHTYDDYTTNLVRQCPVLHFQSANEYTNEHLPVVWRTAITAPQSPRHYQHYRQPSAATMKCTFYDQLITDLQL